jgi:multidrug efflux pump subunit AcrA (membrane-fusion protein)
MAQAEFKGDDFEFPDEKEAKGKPEAVEDDGFDVEIEDDTPKKDRGRKPDDTPPEDPTEDELASYDEKVQSRLKKFTRGYHDERRAKEEALREREAAEKLAKQLWEQNRKLQEQVSLGSRAYIEQSKSSAEMEYENAKKRYKEAYESGDSDAVVEAQAEVAKATLNLDKVQNMRPLQAEENDVQIPQRSTNQPNVSQRDQRWMQKNTWFGTDPEMTASALGLHQKLAKEHGADFVGSDEYYKRVDATMRRRFPEYYEDDIQSDEDDTPSKKVSEPAYEEEPPRRATKPANVVAPASRSTPPNRIRLKASEAAIARRLGVPLEEYAKQVAQLKRGE